MNYFLSFLRTGRIDYEDYTGIGVIWYNTFDEALADAEKLMTDKNILSVRVVNKNGMIKWEINR